MLIRSIIFEIFITLWGMIIPILYGDVFISGSRKRADNGALAWSRFASFVLKKLCGIDYEVRGLENLPKEGGFIVACKHQSMWETMIMHLVFKHPAYAYKKELLKIPFYGWFLKHMSGIAIDRKGGAKALKSLLSDSKKYLENGQVIILFPQGTRVPVGASTDKYPYQPGIAALYSQLKCPIIPAALNSGKFWNKSKTFKRSGKIILEFLPQIDPNTDRKNFLPKLEEAIEKKSEEL